MLLKEIGQVVVVVLPPTSLRRGPRCSSTHRGVLQPRFKRCCNCRDEYAGTPPSQRFHLRMRNPTFGGWHSGHILTGFRCLLFGKGVGDCWGAFHQPRRDEVVAHRHPGEAPPVDGFERVVPIWLCLCYVLLLSVNGTHFQ